MDAEFVKILLSVMLILGVSNYVIGKIQDKKTLAKLREYLAGNHPARVVIDYEMGYGYCRIQFLGGEEFHFNNGSKDGESLTSLLKANYVVDIFVGCYTYGLPPSHDPESFN